MTTGKTFVARPENYPRNHDTGATLRVAPAKLGTPDGHTSGVAIFSRNRVVMVLTTDHAYNLANGIADTLEDTGKDAV
ncbi:hypothetical protein [Paenarthrobacter ureafaciens]|uniref:hypothetical protein n=1 Tax=Paenarthrobacter ureafaciens TaxID=37931 RepID=UPI001C2C61C6|nr:hypothetical protein [Paenarthrobacter ureafaciens]UOD81984.1 hypothetical protein MQZ73_03600 [Paenarthrobacter ureafaciens]WNZ05476.1 hypothetical protein PVT25_08140 [Paenarthrobacter ureafaciens]